MSALFTRFLGTYPDAGPTPIWRGPPGQLDGKGGDFTTLMAVRARGDSTHTVWSNHDAAVINTGWELTVTTSPDTPPAVDFVVGDSGGPRVVRAEFPSTGNGVHLVIGVYIASTAARLYIDGKRRDSTALIGAYIPSTTVAKHGEGGSDIQLGDVGFHSTALSAADINNLYSDFMATGLIRPGAVLNPNAPSPIVLPNIDSVYSVTRSQRTRPVGAFPSVGTGAAVTLNAAEAGPYPLATFDYDSVAIV